VRRRSDGRPGGSTDLSQGGTEGRFLNESLQRNLVLLPSKGDEKGKKKCRSKSGQAGIGWRSCHCKIEGQGNQEKTGKERSRSAGNSVMNPAKRADRPDGRESK